MSKEKQNLETSFPIIKPETIKSEKLKEIQQEFSWKVLKPTVKDDSVNTCPPFIFSNDAEAERCSHYQIELQRLKSTKAPKVSGDTAALIIGSGYLFSVIADIKANIILMAEIHPIVHYTILHLRKLILESTGDFANTKQKILRDAEHLLAATENFSSNEKIQEFTKTLNNSLSKDNIHTQVIKTSLATEIESLGKLHFLHNKDNFDQCKKALQEKTLLTIHLDIFDANRVKLLGDKLKKQKINIIYANLTNVADYDKDMSLPSNLKSLPFTENCFIISTSLQAPLFTQGSKSNRFSNVTLFNTAVIQSPDLDSFIYNIKRDNYVRMGYKKTDKDEDDFLFMSNLLLKYKAKLFSSRGTQEEREIQNEDNTECENINRP